jgi:small-conductance mechanosensitive channel
MSPEILQTEFLENTIAAYLIALAILLVGIIAIKILRNVIIGRLKKWARKTANDIDNSLIRICEGALVPALYLGLFYVAIRNLVLHPILNQALDAIGVIIITIIGIRFVASLAEYLLRLYLLTKDQPNIEQSLSALVPALRAVIWAIGIVFLIDNLGFDIAAVIASLGIGGVAIALASQGVLQDLFSYFSILFDRPFEIGDFIIVGDFVGTVEHVGIKTTRMKSLSGEELILANTDLTSSRIRNYKRMQQRRIAFTIGVIYETPLEQLQAIPGIIQSIIEEVEGIKFDRAHFHSYGDFSLNYEIVYNVTSSDYNQYMNAQQQINFRMMEEFEKRNIEFAYPTQVTYFNNLSNGNSPVAKSEGASDGRESSVPS